MNLIIDFMQGNRKKKREKNIVQHYGFKVNKNEIEILKKKANRTSRSRAAETIIETQT
jgi:hypothetical protein